MKKRNIYITVLASAILFGYAYNLDILQALQGPFREQPFNFTSTDFNLLYFFTFLPTAFFDIPLGIIIDKNPLKVSMYTLLIISLIAQIVIALALEFMIGHYIWVMYGMRSLFGVAGEAMFTVQGVIVAKYAKSDYQIMMGMCLCLPFVMDSINSAVTTAVYDRTGYMALPWYIGALVCFVSLLAAVILNQKYLRDKQKKNKTQKKIQKQAEEEQSTSSDELIQQQFNFKAIKKFKFQFWVLIGAVFFCQSSLGPFIDNLNDLIVKRFNIPYITTGQLLLIPFGFLTPFSLAITILCQKRPKIRRNVILITTVLYFLAMDMLYVLPNTTNPVFYYYLVIIFFLLMMSFLFAVYYSIIVSSLTYVADEQTVGTAFGICGCAIGLAQCLVPIANMQIMSQASGIIHEYENLNMFALILSFLPILFALWIKTDRFKALDRNLIQQSPRKKSQQAFISDLTLKQEPMQKFDLNSSLISNE